MNTLTDTLTDSPERTELAPVPANQRIEALDAVRGFALIGICLMNVEFFNRPMSTLSQGMPVGLTGIDWLASYFVAYFVAGKFWTIFSLLFGMGFAVMLTRAESAGRGFLKPYMRRIAALAVFGALHHIFLFAGDILFSYAVAAVYLLVVLYGTFKWLLAGLAVAIGLAFVPGLGPAAGSSAAALVVSGLIALYMRSEKRPLSLPVISLILLVLGIAGTIAACVMWTMKVGPAEARGPVTAVSVLLLLLSFLSNKYRDPVEARPWRVGAATYLLFTSLNLIGGAVDYFTPPEPVVAVAAAAVAAPAVAAPAIAAPAEVTAPAAVAARADPKKPAAKPELTEAQKKAEAAAERTKLLKERAELVAKETRVMGSGSYVELVKLRAAHFAEHAQTESGFAFLLIPMFLLGAWFIRSGTMKHPGAHLPLFRKLATIGLPVGIAMGLLGSLIATRHLPGAQHDGFGLAHGLLMVGNLPACLGYVSMVVLMLHSRSPFAKVAVLAPFGRMALTNYLGQSLLMASIFLGYGLGFWAMGRAAQVVVALALCGLQIAFSHWWLARFRYGPAEWLWRAVTYLKMPAMRIAPRR
ncbi:MAG: hypothetical protein JWR40_2072 [Massilia sp.]|nr:hypothetical protein [Massilia sp.]MDB5949692.1 hypothetical protein [Massilia sp.]